MTNWTAIIGGLVILILIIAFFTVDIVNCTGELGIAGKTTVFEYLFGGSCRGTVLASSASWPINGILSNS